MLRIASLVFVGLVSIPFLGTEARAEENQSPAEGVQRCLANWGQHPFDPQNPPFRLIEPKVGVFGIGGDFRDDRPTASPELIYVRSNVSVMSKTVLELLNPNGWYCLEKSVSVMSKVEIKVACQAHLATTAQGVSVMGGGDGGVNVMGATVIDKVNCASATVTTTTTTTTYPSAAAPAPAVPAQGGSSWGTIQSEPLPAR